MPKYKLYETHTHTSFSADGFNMPDEMAEKALDIPLFVLSITDHCDLLARDILVRSRVVSEGYQAVLKTKKKYQDKIDIMAGIEIGQAIDEPEIAKNILLQNKYDIIIGSLHDLQGYDESHKIDYTQIDVQLFLKKYFEKLLETAKQGYYDTFAHLDYPTRYIKFANVPYSLSPFMDIIDEILKTLSQNGKALEVNTSGLFHSNETNPNMDIVRHFKELGGEYITVCSDAHRIEHLGRGIDDAMDMLLDVGYRYVTYYKDRRAVPVKIEEI